MWWIEDGDKHLEDQDTGLGRTKEQEGKLGVRTRKIRKIEKVAPGKRQNENTCKENKRIKVEDQQLKPRIIKQVKIKTRGNYRNERREIVQQKQKERKQKENRLKEDDQEKKNERNNYWKEVFRKMAEKNRENNGNRSKRSRPKPSLSTVYSR